MWCHDLTYQTYYSQECCIEKSTKDVQKIMIMSDGRHSIKQSYQNELAYFATTVNYNRKMFMIWNRSDVSITFDETVNTTNQYFN
jgi:hypothetical protein